MSNNRKDIDLIKLKSVFNEIELRMIRAVLDENNIPYIIRDYGSGGHMRVVTGGSIFGADVMVEEADFDDAKSLLESIGMD